MHWYHFGQSPMACFAPFKRKHHCLYGASFSAQTQRPNITWNHCSAFVLNKRFVQQVVQVGHRPPPHFLLWDLQK